MKKKVLAILSVLLLTSMAFGGPSPGFKKLDQAIKGAIPDGYKRNRSQSWDNKFFIKITYDQGGFETNQLIFGLDPNSQSFSPMDLALSHQRMTIADREALFNDGIKTGKSIIKVILKNKAGLFSITFQSMEGRAMSQPAMENLLSKVNLGMLER